MIELGEVESSQSEVLSNLDPLVRLQGLDEGKGVFEETESKIRAAYGGDLSGSEESSMEHSFWELCEVVWVVVD